jgi:hypothetical protein
MVTLHSLVFSERQTNEAEKNRSGTRTVVQSEDSILTCSGTGCAELTTDIDNHPRAGLTSIF